MQPGVYAYVNHNLIEAVNLGAMAHVVVGGDWNNDLMEQVVAPVEHDAAHEGRTALPQGGGQAQEGSLCGGCLCP